MKQEIVNAPILAYYNPKKKTVLQTDASIKGFRSMLPTAGRKTSLLCQQSFYWGTARICCNRNRIACSCLGDGEVSSFPGFAGHFILETDHNLLQAILSKSINQASTKDTKNIDKNFPIPLHCVIYTRIDQPTCRLLVLFRWTKGHYQALQNVCLTRLPTSCVPEVTAYNKIGLLHKKMMRLHCSSIPSHKFGQVHYWRSSQCFTVLLDI